MKRSALRLLILTMSLAVVGSGHTATVADSEKTYDVTIVFLGLMTWDLPDVKPKVATVIIPDVSDGIDEIGNDKHKVHEHVAYVLADTRTMPRKHPLNDHYFPPADEEGADNVKYHYLPLEGELISIDDDNAIVDRKDLDYVNKGCRTDPCPTKDNKTALCWLSSMREVHDGTPQAKDEDNYFNRFPKQTTIAGRMVLRHGDLKAHVVKNIETKTAPVWFFATPKKLGHENDAILPQALAQEVHWTFKAKGVPFVLNLLGFDGESRRLAFVPQDGKVLIVVGNTLPADTGPVADPDGDVKRDLHYSVYHRFIKGNTDGVGRIPHRATTGTVDCKDYVFDPVLMPNKDESLVDILSHHASYTSNNKKPKVVSTTTNGPQPSPGGLNCAANQWQ